MSELRPELLQSILLNNIGLINDFHQKEEKEDYENIIKLTDDNSATTIGKLLAYPDEVVEVFNKMTPLEKAFLYPKINIYKMNANGEYSEIILKNHFDSLQLNLYDSQKVANETILGTNEVFSVGLKSIHIQNRPERESDVNISVKITYLFENIVALLQQPLLDLIKVPLDKDKANMLDFRLKLVIGWSVPNDYSKNPAIDDIFRNALEYSEEIYLLQIYNHNISFNADGSVELVIEYGAAIEGYFDSDVADILNVDNLLLGRAGLRIDKSDGRVYKSSFTSRLPEYQQNYLKIQSLKDNLEVLQKNPSLTQQQIDKINKEITDLEDQNRQYAKFFKNIRYGWILKQIYEQKKIYAIEIDEKILSLYNETLNPEQTSQEEIQKNKFLKEQLDFFFKYGQPVSGPRIIGKDERENVVDLEVINDLAQKTDDGIEVDEEDQKEKIENITEPGALSVDKSYDYSSQIQSNEEEINPLVSGFAPFAPGIVGLARATAQNIANGALFAKDMVSGMVGFSQQTDLRKKPIYYVKLGDIFDVASSFIENKEDYKILFGSVEFYDYKKEQIRTINITDLPIALDHFSVWFVNTVIKPQLDQFFFRRFIENIIGTLVSPLFGYFYEGIKTPMAIVTFNSQIITSTVEIKEKNITTDKLKGFLVSKNKKEKKFFQYYIIYCTVVENRLLRGDIKEDTSKGIYHYKIGSSAGMLTEVKFKKVDNQKLRDARIVSQNLNTPGQVLREHYDCDLSLIGNPLFQNGRMFYIDGSHFGEIGREATETIGLGGYYLTHGIEHVFENGNWTMDVHGYFQSPRYGAYGNPVAGSIDATGYKETSKPRSTSGDW